MSHSSKERSELVASNKYFNGKLSLCNAIIPFPGVSKLNKNLKDKKVTCLNQPQHGDKLVLYDKSLFQKNTPKDKKPQAQSSSWGQVIKMDSEKPYCYNKHQQFIALKQRIERDIEDLFDFLPEQDRTPIADLIETFNHLILKGEIKTFTQMNRFLKKTEELSECVKLYLEKNEYTANFMQEISFDIFKCGF